MPSTSHPQDPSADLDFAALLESLTDTALREEISQSELSHLMEEVGRLGVSQAVPEGGMEKLLDLLGELCVRVSQPVPLVAKPSDPEPDRDAHSSPTIDSPANGPVPAVGPEPPQRAPTDNVDMSAADEIRHHVWSEHQAIPEPSMMVWPNPCQCGMKVMTPDKYEVCWHTLTYGWVCPYCLCEIKLNMGRADYEPPRTRYGLLCSLLSHPY